MEIRQSDFVFIFNTSSSSFFISQPDYEDETKDEDDS